MDTKDIANNMPFFCWQCITIQTKTLDLNLVIKDQNDMFMLLEFLIVSLKTIDGVRNSAQHHLRLIHNNKTDMDDDYIFS